MLCFFGRYCIIETMIDINKIWTEMKKQLSSKMNSVSFAMWVEKCSPYCIKDNVLILLSKNELTKTQISTLYAEDFSNALKSCNSVLSEVCIITEDEKDAFENDRQTDLNKENSFKDNAIKKYNFDSFVVAPCNTFAFNAARAVAEAPGSSFNPLFIYGGVGLGKTHLLLSIYNYVKTNFPQMKVLYANSETFVNDLIDSIRNSKDALLSRAFRDKYRNLDVFILDDVQFLSNKDSTQEALFHTFNELHQQGKQIIFSSDRAPKDIVYLEERLSSRFSWGLVVDIQPPDVETRIAILRKKALSQNFVVDDSVLKFIAEKSNSNVRELESILQRVKLYCSLINKPADSLEIAKEALKDFLSDSLERVTIDSIVNTVCNYFGVNKADVIGKKKTKDLVEPRQIAMFLITDILTVPLASIGNYFSGRDHTTIMHARDKVFTEMKTNTKLKLQISDLKDMIMNK